MRMMQADGSIPACAGEPAHWMRWARAAWVYPRVCGGTLVRAGAYDQVWGLSPRVRGNPQFAGGDHPITRSIPACAGEPWTIPAPT